MYRCWKTQSCIISICSVFDESDCYSAGNVHFHSWSRGCSQLPHKSHCQSSYTCVCLMHQVIVHEVPGQELEVEVYDKDPDQDDFLGRYICIVHVSCVPMLNLALSPFICHLSCSVGKSTLPVIFKHKIVLLKLQHLLSMV